jgi:hypothetical protein
MRFTLAIVFLASFAGCGPLFLPMMPRLNAEDQHVVDQMWDNLLTPIQRVDREALLDTNIAFWMYAIGVDRMQMKSEKYFKGGTAIMEMDCDRANPDADQFTITVLDERGRTIRRERYTRADVEDSARMLRGRYLRGSENGAPLIEGQITIQIGMPTTQSATQSATRPSTTRPLTPDELREVSESERRRAAVVAATQPARVK